MFFEALVFLVLVGVAYFFFGGKRWEWKDKVVVITGASSGIGKEMALRLAEEGAKVVLAARSQELNDVVSECATRARKRGLTGDRAIGVITNVASEIDCRHLIEATIAKFGQLDCLILNAGLSMNATFSDLENVDMIRHLMEVNFYGSVYCTQAGLPHLKAAKDSRILVMSSISGLLGTPNRTGYSASKFALHGFFEALRLEVASSGVSVTFVCPSWVKTNLNKTRLGSQDVVDIDSGMDAGECAALSLQACARGDRVFIPQAKMKIAPLLKVVAPEILCYAQTPSHEAFTPSMLNPRDAAGCERILAQNSSLLKDGDYYPELYNEVVLCVVNNRAPEAVTNFKKCLLEKDVGLDEISFVRPSKLPLCVAENKVVYSHFREALSEADSARPKPRDVVREKLFSSDKEDTPTK